MLSYRKVEPNGLTLFALAGLSEPLSAAEEEVVLCSPALIPYRPNADRCLVFLAFFIPFFQPIQENPLAAAGFSTLYMVRYSSGSAD